MPAPASSTSSLARPSASAARNVTGPSPAYFAALSSRLITIWRSESACTGAASVSSTSKAKRSTPPASGAKRSTVSRSSGASATDLSPHPHHPTLRAGELQDVLDQVSQPPSLLHDHAQGAPPLAFPGGAAQLQRLGVEENLGERGAQLVGDAGGEVGPESRQLSLAAELAQGHGGERRGHGEQRQEERQPRRRPRHRELAGDRRWKHGLEHGATRRRGHRVAGVPLGVRVAQAEQRRSFRRAHLDRRERRVAQTARHRARQQRVPLERRGDERTQRAGTRHHAIRGERRVVHRVAAVAQLLDTVHGHSALGRASPPGEGSSPAAGNHRAAEPGLDRRVRGTREGEAAAAEVVREPAPGGVLPRARQQIGSHRRDRGGGCQRVIGRGGRAPHDRIQRGGHAGLQRFRARRGELERRHRSVVAEGPLRGDPVGASGALCLVGEERREDEGEAEQDHERARSTVHDWSLCRHPDGAQRLGILPGRQDPSHPLGMTACYPAAAAASSCCFSRARRRL